MKNFTKRIALLLCVILIAPAILNCLPSMQLLTKAQAAVKVKAQVTNSTIGILSTPEYVYVLNGKEKAKYTYTSSNKKIATVDKNGKISGVSKGKDYCYGNLQG